MGVEKETKRRPKATFPQSGPRGWAKDQISEIWPTRATGREFDDPVCMIDVSKLLSRSHKCQCPLYIDDLTFTRATE
jgi:hypothetical protein